MTEERVPSVSIIAVVRGGDVKAYVKGTTNAIAEADDIWELSSIISDMYPQGATIELSDYPYVPE